MWIAGLNGFPMTATSIATASTTSAVFAVGSGDSTTTFAVAKCSLANSRSYSILAVFPILDSTQHN
jgi:hypothetical protein